MRTRQMAEETMAETLEDVPVDYEGSIAFSANAAHVRTLKICLTGAVVVALFMTVAAFLAMNRPPQVSIVRVDDVRGAELVKVGTGMDIKTGEIRTALWMWSIWRYRILKSSAEADFAQSYYFFSSDLTAKYRDADARKVAEILTGTEPEQTVDIRTIAIPPMRTVTVGARKVWAGQAQFDLLTSENLNQPRDPHDPTRRKWLVNLAFTVDPIAAAKRGRDDPMSQIMNPLGITITSYYETQEPGEGR